MKLHDLQIQLLRILTENQDTPLTIRELQEVLGASSTSLVHHHIKKLEDPAIIKFY